MNAIDLIQSLRVYYKVKIKKGMRINSNQEIEESDVIFHDRLGYDHHLDSGSEKKQMSRFNKVLCIMVTIVFFSLLGFVSLGVHSMEDTQHQPSELQSVSHLIASKARIQNYKPSDFYWFSVSTRDLILNSDLGSLYRRDRKVYSMSRQTHLRGILLTQLIHSVNFKGQIKVQMSPFDRDFKKKQKVIKQLIQYQKSYYQPIYNISKYSNHQLPFCIVVPSYNNIKSKLYRRNLDSLFMQDYHNYRIVYIDDHSPQNTGEFVKKYIEEKNIPQQKIQIIVNQVNKKALQNIYEAVHLHCKQGQIVALIDGDDSLNGRQVLQLYNAIFHQKKSALLYSNFLKITSNSRTQFGFGSQVYQQYFEAGYLRKYWPIVGTHFMAFYTDLFKQIKKEDLCYDNGTFYDYAYDRAIITPLLQLSYPRNTYVPEMVYEYRNDTGINDGTYEWSRVSDMIQSKPAYESLKEFAFIDENPIIRGGEKSNQD